MSQTVIIRTNKEDNKVFKKSTFMLSGNYLIIITTGDGEKTPDVREVFDLKDIKSWSTKRMEDKNDSK
jgi:hypothetical protein